MTYTPRAVAGMLGNDLVLGHVGDSRAYLLRGNTFRQLTTDHTLAQALIDAGVASSDDPASRSMRHVLTAAIGSLDERVEPQVQPLSRPVTGVGGVMGEDSLRQDVRVLPRETILGTSSARQPAKKRRAWSSPARRSGDSAR